MTNLDSQPSTSVQAPPDTEAGLVRDVSVSVVVPVLNERENLRPLVAEIEEVLRAAVREFEIILVDDGSRDGSTELIAELCNEHSFVHGIVFRQNFGQAAAFDAGFREATGDIVVTIDADLQNDPHDIPAMIDKLQSGFDLVAGRRAVRRDGVILRTAPSRLANFLIRRVTKTRIRDLGCSLKVYRREITRDLRLYGEMHRFIAVLVEATGARTTEMDVRHRARTAGTSKYGLSRTFKVLLDLMTVWFLKGYQTKPIYVFGGAGFVLMLMSIILAIYVLYQKFAFDVWVHRNPLFVLSLVFTVIAVQFVGMGLIAEIIVRTYFESQRKSSYIVSARLGFSTNE